MNDEKKRPDPFYLLTELLSDLQFVVRETTEVIEWLSGTEDERRRRHLARLAVVYMAFVAQTAWPSKAIQ